jgi:hypothetical protein
MHSSSSHWIQRQRVDDNNRQACDECAGVRPRGFVAGLWYMDVEIMIDDPKGVYTAVDGHTPSRIGT